MFLYLNKNLAQFTVMNKKYLTLFHLAKKKSVLFLMVMLVAIIASSFKKNSPVLRDKNCINADSTISKKAFLAVYEVMLSPRCMNCHPAGDVPLVGDESKLHPQGAKRGKDGRGMYASKCVNCHLDSNQAGLNMPPGVPDWRLPPADMKMVFQGKIPRELAAQLLDTATNNHKTTAALIEHISADQLVLEGWNPGEGRKLPPISHAEFTKQFKLWIEQGAYLPD
jgi:hypothetical protein